VRPEWFFLTSEEGKMNLRAIGIDLGTTNTMVATVTSEGHTAVLRDRDGETSLPSAVLFADERTIVGREAQLRGRVHPQRLAACAKRSVGQPFYEHKIGGEWIPPEVIQACILRQVRTQLLGPADKQARAVIAVPAHFNEIQRHTTVMAAEMAGVRFLDLVNEPIAAALAMAEDAPAFALGSNHDEPNTYLVFDLGGYTFELTVLSVRPGEIKMVATDHDLFLGGHDWDLRVADLMAEHFVREHGVDPREDPRQLDTFMQRACQIKHALTDHQHAAAHVEFSGKGANVKISVEQFERAAADLMERVAAQCDQLLQRAGVEWSRLKQVLLVGGATRTPMIRRMLSQRLGREVDIRVNPEEAVARGAAIYAAEMMNRDRAPPKLQVTSMSTHSLGIEGVDQETGERINKVLIPKGTALPATAKREFTSKTNAKHAIVFNVLEGEHRLAAKCTKIGQIMLTDLPEEISDQWPVDVSYEYSPSGQLSVIAHVRYTDRRVRMTTVRPAGVSSTHMEKWREVIESREGYPAYQRVRAWERAADAPPPVVVAGLPPAPPPAPPEPEEPEGVTAFLRRMMPFLFRSRESTQAEAKEH